MLKLKVFLWQLYHASLSTRGTLLKRGLKIYHIFPLYNIDIEDVEYLFLQCHAAQEVWRLGNDHK